MEKEIRQYIHLNRTLFSNEVSWLASVRIYIKNDVEGRNAEGWGATGVGGNAISLLSPVWHSYFWLLILYFDLGHSCWPHPGIGERGWLSGESTRLPPMWLGFDSWTRRQMWVWWVEFVVGSRPCFECFFLRVLRFFLLPRNPTLPNSNSIRNLRATGLSVEKLFSVTLVKHSRFR